MYIQEINLLQITEPEGKPPSVVCTECEIYLQKAKYAEAVLNISDSMYFCYNLNSKTIEMSLLLIYFYLPCLSVLTISH